MEQLELLLPSLELEAVAHLMCPPYSAGGCFQAILSTPHPALMQALTRKSKPTTRKSILVARYWIYC
jgi:hypothetical protein